jgi:hypothetical protein
MAFTAKPFVSLEDIDTREGALADPRRSLPGCQTAPFWMKCSASELLSYLQGVVDTRGRMGNFGSPVWLH